MSLTEHQRHTLSQLVIQKLKESLGKTEPLSFEVSLINSEESSKLIEAWGQQISTQLETSVEILLTRIQTQFSEEATALRALNATYEQTKNQLEAISTTLASKQKETEDNFEILLNSLSAQNTKNNLIVQQINANGNVPIKTQTLSQLHQNSLNLIQEVETSFSTINNDISSKKTALEGIKNAIAAIDYSQININIPSVHDINSKASEITKATTPITTILNTIISNLPDKMDISQYDYSKVKTAVGSIPSAENFITTYISPITQLIENLNTLKNKIEQPNLPRYDKELEKAITAVNTCIGTLQAKVTEFKNLAEQKETWISGQIAALTPPPQKNDTTEEASQPSLLDIINESAALETRLYGQVSDYNAKLLVLISDKASTPDNTPTTVTEEAEPTTETKAVVDDSIKPNYISQLSNYFNNEKIQPLIASFLMIIVVISIVYILTPKNNIDNTLQTIPIKAEAPISPDASKNTNINLDIETFQKFVNYNICHDHFDAFKEALKKQINNIGNIEQFCLPQNTTEQENINKLLETLTLTSVYPPTCNTTSDYNTQKENLINNYINTFAKSNSLFVSQIGLQAISNCTKQQEDFTKDLAKFKNFYEKNHSHNQWNISLDNITKTIQKKNDTTPTLCLPTKPIYQQYTLSLLQSLNYPPLNDTSKITKCTEEKTNNYVHQRDNLKNIIKANAKLLPVKNL